MTGLQYFNREMLAIASMASHRSEGDVTRQGLASFCMIWCTFHKIALLTEDWQTLETMIKRANEGAYLVRVDSKCMQDFRMEAVGAVWENSTGYLLKLDRFEVVVSDRTAEILYQGGHQLPSPVQFFIDRIKGQHSAYAANQRNSAGAD